MDDHVIHHYDVQVIDYGDKTYKSIEDHPWGMFYLHYDMSFYQDFFRKFLTIALENALREKELLLDV
ncbi:hypothetical protein [Bacillus changyiensis]|uniref:hypothetical protein n=1 Tax=Bacillus changyiensis TaxID=3004103 RepID=UPI0022E3C500|nr:hypothetical protein [Bacillus changyiensis]MDA1474911.1 hypothetical protein [Bacillus changyiensis]